MSGDVIVTVTLNAALHVAYTAGAPAAEDLPARPLLGGPIPPDPPLGGATPPSPPQGIVPVSPPRYPAGGRGGTGARGLRALGHHLLAARLGRGAARGGIMPD